MEMISRLFKLRALQLYFDEEFYNSKNLTELEFDVLLSLAMVTEGTQREAINNKTLRGFMENYLKPISVYRLVKTLDTLHEKNLVWVNSLTTVSITKLGKNLVKEIYYSQNNFERKELRPIVRAVRSGAINFYGLLLSKISLPKRNKNNPYTGVERVGAHKFRATIKVNKKKINLGIFKKAVLAAKIRDAYIRDNKLGRNYKYSLKQK